MLSIGAYSDKSYNESSMGLGCSRLGTCLYFNRNVLFRSVITRLVADIIGNLRLENIDFGDWISFISTKNKTNRSQITEPVFSNTQLIDVDQQQSSNRSSRVARVSIFHIILNSTTIQRMVKDELDEMIMNVHITYRCDQLMR